MTNVKQELEQISLLVYACESCINNENAKDKLSFLKERSSTVNVDLTRIDNIISTLGSNIFEESLTDNDRDEIIALKKNAITLKERLKKIQESTKRMEDVHQKNGTKIAATNAFHIEGVVENQGPLPNADSNLFTMPNYMLCMDGKCEWLSFSDEEKVKEYLTSLTISDTTEVSLYKINMEPVVLSKRMVITL